jgi:hypothetical protein
MELVLEEQRRDCYHDAQPPELGRRPRGKLEEEGRGVVPPRHYSAAPSARPGPPRTTTPRKARITLTFLPPPMPPPRQRHLKKAIQTTPQHTHCRSPTLPSHSQSPAPPADCNRPRRMQRLPVFLVNHVIGIDRGIDNAARSRRHRALVPPSVPPCGIGRLRLLGVAVQGVPLRK